MKKDGQEKYEFGTMTNASRDMYMTASEEDRLTYKLVRVEGHGSFFPTSEDEVIEVEHLLAEPKDDKVLVDSILCFNSENPATYLAVEEFPSSLDYRQQKIDKGALDSDITQEGKEESKLDFLDGMLEGVDEEGDFHVTNILSNACDDYLLDTEFTEKVPDLDYDPDGSNLGNLGLQKNSPGLIGWNSTAAGKSELSTTIPVPNSNPNQNEILLDTMTVHELHEVFRSTFGRRTSVNDKQWLKRRISFGLHNLVELGNASSLLESGISTSENEGDMTITSNNNSSERMHRSFTSVLGNKIKSVGHGVVKESLVHRDGLTTNSDASKVGFGLLNFEDGEGERVTQKRLRKPTRRYIEESSELKSRYCSGRLETRVNSHNQCHRKGFGAMPSVSRPDSLGRSGIQVPFCIRPQKGRPKKDASILWHDSDNKAGRLVSVSSEHSYEEPFPTDSQDDMSDDCLTTVRTEKSRRKHHRLWTLSEVMKLIDGVSQYGVGRWTEIKRLLFSSSAYRTSVDLKDKWRNLLRASCAELQSKREVEQGRKHAVRPIPVSVLRRVSELAIIYPYPRERKSKLTPVPTVASQKPASASGRIVVQRKNLS